MTWLKIDGLENFYDEFSMDEGAASPAMLRHARSVLDEIIEDFRESFGDFRSLSLHGSEFGRAVRKRCAERTDDQVEVGACDLEPLSTAKLFSTSAFDDLNYHWRGCACLILAIGLSVFASWTDRPGVRYAEYRHQCGMIFVQDGAIDLAVVGSSRSMRVSGRPTG